MRSPRHPTFVKVEQWRDALFATDFHRDTPLRNRLVAGVYLLVHALYFSDLTSRASSLTFTLLLAIIPMLTTGMAFFTSFPGLSSQRERLTGILFDQLLPSAVSSVREHLAHFAQLAAAAGTLSSLFFLVTVMLFFQSLETAVDRIWRDEVGRTWGGRVQAIAVFLLLGSVSVAALVLIRSEVAQLSQAFTVTPRPWVKTLLSQAASLLAACVVFTMATKVLPNIKVPWKAALAGGLSSGIAWHFMKELFTFYVARFAHYENIYGVLGVIPAFFLWAYLSMLLLLIGAQIAFIHANLNALTLSLRLDRTGHSRVYYALSVAEDLARAFILGAAPVNADEIAKGLDVAPYFVKQAIGPLIAANVLLEIADARAEPCYTLARPPDSIPLLQIVQHVTREPFEVPVDVVSSDLARKLEALFAEVRSPTTSAFARATLGDLLDQPKPEPIPE